MVLNLKDLSRVEMENILKFFFRVLRSDGIGGRIILVFYIFLFFNKNCLWS